MNVVIAVVGVWVTSSPMSSLATFLRARELRLMLPVSQSSLPAAHDVVSTPAICLSKCNDWLHTPTQRSGVA